MAAPQPSSLPLQQEVTLTGQLLKRGHFVKSWRKRYFVLKGNILCYSVSDGSAEKGSFLLTKTTVVAESSLQEHCFALIDGKRELILVANDEAEMTEWMEALQETVTTQTFTYSTSKSIGSAKLNRIYPRQRDQNSLTVKVVRARGLSAKNKNNTSCPYAIIQVGSDKARSTTIGNQLNPTWNETFTFPFDRSQRFARVEIWDEDSGVAKDRFLGLIIIPLFMLPCRAPQSKWYGLGKRTSRSRVGGEVFIELSCNVEVELMAEKMLKDISRLPELSLLPYLNTPGLLNGNSNFNETVSYFPGEVLEDMSMHVIMKADLGGECFYSNGIMMLTNYRVIFVGASRLNASRRADAALQPDDPKGDICTYVTIGAIVQVSMGEEPDYLNPSLSVETIRLRTSDSRVLTLLFRDTAFVGDGSVISTPSLSVDAATHGYGTASIGNSARSISLNPSTTQKESRPLLGDDDDLDAPTMRDRRANRRKSLNPELATGMVEQVRNLFKSLATSTEAENEKKPQQQQQRSVSSASMLNMKDLISLGEDIEDDTHFLEACESAEGPPSQRIYASLNYRVLNRHLEFMHSSGLLRTIVMTDNTTAVDNTVDPLGGTDSPVTTTTTSEPSVSVSEAERLKEVSKRGGIREHAAPVNIEAANGWDVYDPIIEFNRLSIPDSYWKLSIANSNGYSLCDTYPAVVAIPFAIDDATLEGSAQFRSRNRFPALSWRHPRNKTSLTRCSQPMVGIGQKRSTEDETLLQFINAARGFAGVNNPDASKSTAAQNVKGDRKGSYEYKKPLIIMDARPKINAQANQAAGKGFELPKFYVNTNINFLEIANIHAVRASLESLEELCCNDAGSEATWLKNVETTGWLTHIRKILSGAARIVHCMDQEELSVVVHCSDGWDRTAQLISLAMLMMDSHYRTLSGFMTLIEKEWFSFGHKFCDRLGFSVDGWGSDDRSPVFQQFIECVFQFMSQLPSVFEFNESLLIYILRGIQSGLFGNIYGNCEKDRGPHRHSMLSMWSVVLSNRAAFINNGYVLTSRPCVPVTSAKRITVWNNWFLAWHDMVWSRIWHGRMEELVAADESFVDSLMPPIRWIDNNASKQCSNASCGRVFTVYRRRHHCRACGLLFCERCSSHRRIVASVSSTTLSRTCKSCAHQIDMANRFMSRAVNRPRAVGINQVKRNKFSEHTLVLSDDSEEEGALFQKSAVQDQARVASLARKFELTGQSTTSEKRRSISFS